MSELAGLTPLDVKKKLDWAESESIVNPLRDGRVEKIENGAFSQICEIAQPSGVVELDRVLQALHERHEVERDVRRLLHIPYHVIDQLMTNDVEI